MKLEELFCECEKRDPSCFSRINDGPLDLYVGSSQGKRAVSFITSDEPPDLPQFASIAVSKSRREDGRWATLLRLERAQFRSLFWTVVEDLVRAALEKTEERAAYRAFVSRVRFWRDLFALAATKVLPDLALMGLLGELLFLKCHAFQSRGPDASVFAWRGPLRSPRDFQFEDRSVEVKAAAPDASDIEISSLDQLTLDVRPLILGVVRISLTHLAGANTSSVAQLVSHLKQRCQGAPNQESFNDRLLLAGYSDLPDYESIHFNAEPFEFYLVNATFPRIDRLAVPSALIHCRYGLHINSLDTFRIESWEPTP